MTEQISELTNSDRLFTVAPANKTFDSYPLPPKNDDAYIEADHADLKFKGSKSVLSMVLRHDLEKECEKQKTERIKIIAKPFFAVLLILVLALSDVDTGLFTQIISAAGNALSAQESTSYNPVKNMIKQSQPKDNSSGKGQPTGPPASKQCQTKENNTVAYPS